MRPLAAARSIKKNRQFLAKPAGTGYCFSERPTGSVGASWARRDQSFGARTGKWLAKRRRKPLKSLKMDSGTGDAPVRGHGKENRAGEFRIN